MNLKGKMSNIFNFNRFRKLFVKHTTEHYRSYLMSAMVFSGILVLLYGFVILTDGIMNHGFRLSAAAILYLLAGGIFTSTIFSEYSQKNKAIVALALPASHFEKFIVGWVYSYVLYTVVFTLCFSLVDVIYMHFTNQFETEKNLLNILPKENFLALIFCIFSVLHSVFLFGAVYFQGLQFVRTALGFFIGIVLLCIFHFNLLKALLPNENVQFNPPFINGLRTNPELANFKNVDLGGINTDILVGMMLIGVTLTMWTASFFQIKEKQI